MIRPPCVTSVRPGNGDTACWRGHRGHGPPSAARMVRPKRSPWTDQPSVFLARCSLRSVARPLVFRASLAPPAKPTCSLAQPSLRGFRRRGRSPSARGDPRKAASLIKNARQLAMLSGSARCAERPTTPRTKDKQGAARRAAVRIDARPMRSNVLRFPRSQTMGAPVILGLR